MTGTGSQIVKAIEAAWKDIQANHKEIADVVVVTGSGWHQKGHDRWAHFWPNRWQEKTEGDTPPPSNRKPELFVAGQLLKEPGRRIMQTLLHEAAHALNFARTIQDCNVNGRHNLKFVAAAKELGDEWPEGQAPHKTHGFSGVLITEAAAERYAETIDALESARLAHLTDLAIGSDSGNGGETGKGGTGTGGSGGRGSRGGSKGGVRINVVCECEESDPFPISPGRLERKPIMCPDCGELYRPQHAGELHAA